MSEVGLSSYRRLAVIRVRGIVNASKDVIDTLNLLHLRRNCHATLVDSRPDYIGMLQKVQNYVAWGEISKEVLALLLRKRGRIVGDKRLTDEHAQRLGFNSIEGLAEAIHEGRVDYKSLPYVKPFFRLHPPSKGFKGSVKKAYRAGGETGHRGEAINELLKRMI